MNGCEPLILGHRSSVVGDTAVMAWSDWCTANFAEKHPKRQACRYTCNPCMLFALISYIFHVESKHANKKIESEKLKKFRKNCPTIYIILTSTEVIADMISANNYNKKLITLWVNVSLL